MRFNRGIGILLSMFLLTGCEKIRYLNRAPDEVLSDFSYRHFSEWDSERKELSIYPMIDKKNEFFDFKALENLPATVMLSIETLVIVNGNRPFDIINGEEFTIVKNMRYLKRLEVEGVTLRSLVGIEGLPLTLFAISACPVEDFTPLESCLDLEFVGVGSIDVREIPDFSKQKRLREIFLRNTSLKSLKNLELIDHPILLLNVLDNPDLNDFTALLIAQVKILVMDEEVYERNKDWFESNMETLKRQNPYFRIVFELPDQR